MTDELTKREEKSLQSLFDLRFLYGFIKIKTTFRHNHHSIALIYLIFSFAGNIYLTHFISHWFAISLFITTFVPFIVVFIISIKNRTFFSSEEHIEIINQQELSLQGNKKIGTNEVIEDQTLMYKDEKKPSAIEPGSKLSERQLPVGRKRKKS